MPSPSRPPGAWRAVLLVAAKELRASFRDRQTAIYAIVLPICLYPLLFWALIQAAQFIEGRRERTEVSVAVARAQDDPLPAGLAEALRFPAEAAENELYLEIEPVRIEPGPETANLDGARAWLGMQGKAAPDAVLLFRAEHGADEAPTAILYDSTSSRSMLAESRLRTRMQTFGEGLRTVAAAERGVDPRELVPLDVERRDLSAAEDRGAYLLSFLLPMLLVAMAVLGAFFPAVDLTAGERERHTMETTLLLPIPRLAIHQGKILAVSAAALLATALNLLALGLSAGHLLSTFAAGADLKIELPIMAFLAIAPLALLFAFFVSAVLTGVAAFAKSFQSGQALLGPVQMVFIFPAMAGVIPGLELTAGTAMIPVVNVVLAFRSMLRGDSLPLEYSLTAASLLAFALLSTWLAVRVLARERIQLSSDSIPLMSIFRLLRSQGGGR